MKKGKYALMVGFWIVLLGIMMLYAESELPIFANAYENLTVKAKVIDITDRYEANLNDESALFHQGISIEFKAEVLSGSNKGKIVSALQNVDSDDAYDIDEIKKGDKVMLAFFFDEKIGNYWLMSDFIRTDFLILLFVLFSIAVILFGRIKGMNTLLSLLLTCICVFKVFIPAVLSGKNIYLWSIMICMYIVLMTLTIVNGLNKKCLCSSLGCLAGTATAGLLTIISDLFLRLTGVTSDESLYLKFLLDKGEIDLKAIIFASILIGSVGAIMDVSTSVSSSLYEISHKVKNCSMKSILGSGASIGRDIMGTMANTLVLAYIGGSMSLTLLLFAYSNSWLSLFNREMIVVEVLQALVGSFAILLTIPLTSFVSGIVYTGGLKKFAENLVKENEEDKKE